jgi:hypothetical protein
MERMLLFIFIVEWLLETNACAIFFFVLVASRRRRRVLRPNRADRSSGRQDNPGRLDYALRLSIVFFDAQFSPTRQTFQFFCLLIFIRPAQTVHIVQR